MLLAMRGRLTQIRDENKRHFEKKKLVVKEFFSLSND